MPRSSGLKPVKLLGKVDRFPPFLLEMAHAEGTQAIAQHDGDCLVADIGWRDSSFMERNPLSPVLP